MTDLTTITTDQLETVTGGFDFAGLASGIGGLIDQFTGGKYGVQQKVGQIAGLVQSFKGGGGAPQAPTQQA